MRSSDVTIDVVGGAAATNALGPWLSVCSSVRASDTHFADSGDACSGGVLAAGGGGGGAGGVRGARSSAVEVAGGGLGLSCCVEVAVAAESRSSAGCGDGGLS